MRSCLFRHILVSNFLHTASMHIPRRMLWGHGLCNASHPVHVAHVAAVRLLKSAAERIVGACVHSRLSGLPVKHTCAQFLLSHCTLRLALCPRAALARATCTGDGPHPMRTGLRLPATACKHERPSTGHLALAPPCARALLADEPGRRRHARASPPQQGRGAPCTMTRGLVGA